MDSEYKMVIVTRSNLTLSLGKLAAQVGHAAVECALQTKKNKPIWFKKWKNEGGKKIIVRVKDLNVFYNLKKKADLLGIYSIIIEDAGHTEIPTGTKTVLGIGPAPNNLIDQVTGNLSLL
jgi:PTH2 family peptidyl-tRNA hydrolase